MAKSYHLGRARRLINTMMGPLAHVGLAGRHTYNLTVRGRKTGRGYSVPVILIENRERWLSSSPTARSAEFADARASGEVQLRRAGRSERLRIQEVTPELSRTRRFRHVLAPCSAFASVRAGP